MLQKSFKKIIGIVIACVTLLLIVAYVVIRNYVSPEKIKEAAITQIEMATGRNVHIDNVRLIFFPVPGISFKKVHIGTAHRADFYQKPFFTCDDIIISVSLFSILKRKPHIRKIFLKRPFVEIEIDSSGTASVDDFYAPLQKGKNDSKVNKGSFLPPLPIPPSLKFLVIKEGKFTFHNITYAKKYVLSNINNRYLFAIDPSFRNVKTWGECSIKKISVLSENEKKEYKKAPITLRHNFLANLVAGTAEVKELYFEVGKINGTITGTLSHLNETPLCSLIVLSSFNTPDLQNLDILPDDITLTEGNVLADIALKGLFDPSDFSKLRIEGHIELTDIIAELSSFKNPIKCKGVMVFTSDKIKNNFDVLSGKSSSTWSATLQHYHTFFQRDSLKRSVRPELTFQIALSSLDFTELLKDSTTSLSPKRELDSIKMKIIPPILLPNMDSQGKITINSLIYKELPLENISLSLHSKNDTAQIHFSAQVAEGTIDDSVAIVYSNLPDIWFSNRCNLKNVEVSSVLHTINNLLPEGDPPKSENSNINGIKGKADIACSIKGKGKSRDLIIKNLKGTFFVAMKSGTVDNSLIVNRLSTAVEKFIKIDNITFQDLSSTCVIARKKFIIQDLKLKSNTGDWRAYGTIGFNSNISLKIKNRLTKPMSQQVIKVESGGKSILKGLLRGTRYARTAEKIINNVHIPTDREGRVTLKLSLEGTTDNPVAKFNGFSR